MKKILSFLLLSAIVFKSFAQQDTNIVKTNAGLVSGIRNKAGDVHIFKGIPFAASPVDGLRWKAPQPVHSWTGIKKCDVFAASAVQQPPVPFSLWSKEFMAPMEPINEDCLYLNVWTTSIGANEKKPVIVWIHGGGFTGGSGSVPVYDGEAMAKKGVVFVTINYRLGVFGFLSHPELTAESGYNASGNYGLLDQVAALQWVKDNIAAFGGDANRVTIAGQSAGAFSICALMASPLAKGLFQRAIAESGGMFNADRTLHLKDAEQTGVQFAAKLQAANIKELRSMSAQKILQAGGNFSPVIDGYLLPADVYSIFEGGKQNDVALLTGWNNDEGFLPPRVLSAESFKKMVEKNYTNVSDEFLKAFPASTDEEAKASQKSLSRDEIFAWQNYTWAKLQTTTGKQKAYLYTFSRKPPGEPDNGAFHLSEIAYALHTLAQWDRPWTNADKKLEELMNSYWVNFAATGNPNSAGLPEWPAFDISKTKLMDFDKNSKVKNNFIQKELDVLDKYQQQLRK